MESLSVTSSKYAIVKSHLDSDRALDKVKLNRRGPKGSPRCTPSSELKMYSPNLNEDGDTYEDDT